jgi:hypothetical protein
MAMVGLLTALPGTGLHRRLLRENRIINDGSGNNTHDLEMNFTPVMNEDILIAATVAYCVISIRLRIISCDV